LLLIVVLAGCGTDGDKKFDPEPKTKTGEIKTKEGTSGHETKVEE
jgi:hypothetical protein